MNRNIIFVGKTRSGKSTALDILKTPFTFVKLASIFSDTIDARINHFTVEVDVEDGKLNFNISIIDTPGLFEVSSRGTSRDNDALEEIVLKCMNSEITKINAIFFVFSYSGSINPQDIDALESFLKLFEGAQKHVHLLITKCEGFTKEEKEKIKTELQQYPRMKDLFGVISKSVFFSGAVELRTYDSGFIDAFKTHLTNTIEMRDNLFGEIFNMSDSFDLHTLKMVDRVRERADKLFVEIKEKFAKKDSVEIQADWLKSSCKKLGTWIPLLPLDQYDKANQLLLECEKYIKELEKVVEK